jgi:hypothetical protein
VRKFNYLPSPNNHPRANFSIAVLWKNWVTTTTSLPQYHSDLNSTFNVEYDQKEKYGMIQSMPKRMAP